MTKDEVKGRYLEALDAGPGLTNAEKVEALAEFVEGICGCGADAIETRRRAQADQSRGVIDSLVEERDAALERVKALEMERDAWKAAAKEQERITFALDAKLRAPLTLERVEAGKAAVRAWRIDCLMSDAQLVHAVVCGVKGEPTVTTGHGHIVAGQFQSDKYPSCPRGKVPLSTADATAQDLLWEYAQRRRAVDAGFSDDLERCLLVDGFVPNGVEKSRPATTWTDKERAAFDKAIKDAFWSALPGFRYDLTDEQCERLRACVEPAMLTAR